MASREPTDEEVNKYAHEQYGWEEDDDDDKVWWWARGELMSDYEDGDED
jgi:hypothetical protein